MMATLVWPKYFTAMDEPTLLSNFPNLAALVMRERRLCAAAFRAQV
jgi:hypothetical protein